MSDKNNGPAANTWGTVSNKQDNTPSQTVPWDTSEYKKMAESQNNTQVKVNNSHGNENSDDIDDMTGKPIISGLDCFGQDFLESGLTSKEKVSQLINQKLKQVKEEEKQANKEGENHSHTCANSDYQTNPTEWMKGRKNMFENRQKDNNTDLQTDESNNQQNMKGSNSGELRSDIGTFKYADNKNSGVMQEKTGNTPSQTVPWDTSKYKEMAESQNNAQVKVNNSHGNENSDDIDDMTGKPIISGLGCFGQDFLESGLTSKEKTSQLIKQKLKLKQVKEEEKQANKEGENHSHTCANSDYQTNPTEWMKDRKNMLENRQKNNNMNPQTDKTDKLNNEEIKEKKDDKKDELEKKVEINQNQNQKKVVLTEGKQNLNEEIKEKKDDKKDKLEKKVEINQNQKKVVLTEGKQNLNEKIKEKKDDKKDELEEKENKTTENGEKKEQNQKTENRGIFQYLKAKLLKIIGSILSFVKSLKDKFSKSAKENNIPESIANNFSQQQDFLNGKSKILIGANNSPIQRPLKQDPNKQ